MQGGVSPCYCYVTYDFVPPPDCTAAPDNAAGGESPSVPSQAPAAASPAPNRINSDASRFEGAGAGAGRDTVSTAAEGDRAADDPAPAGRQSDDLRATLKAAEGFVGEPTEGHICWGHYIRHGEVFGRDDAARLRGVVVARHCRPRQPRRCACSVGYE